MFAEGGWFVKERATVSGLALLRHPVGDGPLHVYVAERPDDLLEALTEEAFRASDERLPYFATLWPAGESLALAVLEGPPLSGLTALDLGCGVGAVGLAARARGAEVTCLDWEPLALDVVRLAAHAQGLGPLGAVVADWRRAPDLPRFDRVFAADVLYEERNLPAVAAFLAGHLQRGGEAWIADPGRPGAAGLEACLRAEGLVLRAVDMLPARADGIAVRRYRVAFPG